MLTETRYQLNKREYNIAESTDLRGTWKNSRLFATGGDLVFVEGARKWTNYVSHGELIRSAHDEKMEIESLEKVDFLIQGALQVNYIDYSDIPWQIGIIKNYSS